MVSESFFWNLTFDFFIPSQASFVSSKGEEEIDIDDPDFWQKWAKKADLDVDLINKVIMTQKFGPSNKLKRVKLL